MRLYNNYTRPLAVNTVVTTTADEPVLIGELEEWLRIDEGDDTAMVEALIKAARIRCEQLCNQDLIVKSYVIKYDDFRFNFDTNVYPIDQASPITVTYWDTDNNDIEYTSTDIRIDGTCFIFNEVAEVYDRADAITLEFSTAPIADHVDLAKVCIKLLVAKWYDNRATGKQDVPDSVEVMMKAIRMIKC